MIKDDNELFLYDVYSELSLFIGKENMEKVYELYKGQQINFPVRLYKPECIKIYIQRHPSVSAKDVAKKFGYSERRIREIKKNIEN